jgi:organic hydroperoxide reductase OsmC/OhrA
MNILYKAHATSTGGGRDEGRSHTDDGKIDVLLSLPPEMGGKGGAGTNPEQLFATGYAACYMGALRLVSGKAGTPVGPGHENPHHRRHRPEHAWRGASTWTSPSRSPTTASTRRPSTA